MKLKRYFLKRGKHGRDQKETGLLVGYLDLLQTNGTKIICYFEQNIQKGSGSEE